jgi:hypothetical protein
VIKGATEADPPSKIHPTHPYINSPPQRTKSSDLPLTISLHPHQLPASSLTFASANIFQRTNNNQRPGLFIRSVEFLVSLSQTFLSSVNSHDDVVVSSYPGVDRINRVLMSKLAIQ